MAVKKKATTTRARGSGVHTKKAVKKAVKKTVVKKVVKKSTAKKTTKTAKKTTKKITPSKKDTFAKKAGPLAFPRSISLAVFTPIVPLNPDQIAIGVARYAGAFFILAGAFLASFNLLGAGYLQLPFTQQIEQMANTSASSQDDFVTQLPSLTSIPDADIDYEINEDQPLSGNVVIEMEIDGPYKLDVSVFDIESERSYKLGTATKEFQQPLWEREWDTTNVPDGTYKIVTHVFGHPFDEESEATQFVDRSSKTFVVENHPSQADEEESETSQTANESGSYGGEAVEDAEDPVVALSLLQKPTIKNITSSQESPLSGSVRFDILAENAAYVRVLGIHTKTNKQYSFGKAFDGINGAWKLNLPTANYPDGAYKLTFLAVSTASEAVREVRDVVFANTDSNSETTYSPVDTSLLTPLDLDGLTIADITPEMEISVRGSDSLTGYADVLIKVEDIALAELFSIGKYSGIKKYIGTATKKSDEYWSFAWNTEQTPNGEYNLVARVKNMYGHFESDLYPVTVANQVEAQPVPIEKEEFFDTIKEVAADVAESSPAPKPDVQQRERSSDTESSTEATLEDRVQNVSEVEAVDIERIYRDFESDLGNLLNLLTAVMRAGGAKTVEDTKKRIENLKKDTLALVTDSEDRKRLENRLETKIDEAIRRVEEDVSKTNKIVKERTGESATKDSDNDGVTDYDEITIYNTDPLSADSDNDGFNDGDELLRGFNPKDATPEALVAYESPKDVGIVREDILKVASIEGVEESDTEIDSGVHEAVIMGTALPNSFATLYVFSTPVIVTVKADSDGSWVYRFDKELEDGEHEVYVGVTDNAGRIVAKSEPLRFLKVAQAFTPVDAQAPAASISQSSDQASFASQRMLLIILSISVVTIGLVLVLIGVQLSRRKEMESYPNASIN